MLGPHVGDRRDGSGPCQEVLPSVAGPSETTPSAPARPTVTRANRVRRQRPECLPNRPIARGVSEISRNRPQFTEISERGIVLGTTPAGSSRATAPTPPSTTRPRPATRRPTGSPTAGRDSTTRPRCSAPDGRSSTSSRTRARTSPHPGRATSEKGTHGGGAFASPPFSCRPSRVRPRSGSTPALRAGRSPSGAGRSRRPAGIGAIRSDSQGRLPMSRCTFPAASQLAPLAGDAP